MLSLLAIASLLASPADTTPGQPNGPAAIQISLNNDGNFTPGGLVQVRVQTVDDGYLTVFRIDGDGRIRVLFPLDPGGDAFVRGGKEYELRGRGDRGTFLADDQSGSGMVYAAISHEPYQVHDFSANGHWDYNALRLPDSSSDPENDLTSLLAAMTSHARFDYDAVGYRVEEVGTVTSVGVGNGYYPGFYDPMYNPRWRCLGCGWYAGGSDINGGLGFGYSPFYDPLLYSPWAYGYSPYGFGFSGGGYFPGSYPIYGTPRTVRSRPRPGPVPAPSVSSRFGNGGVGGVRATPGGGGYGVRARPRPVDMVAPGRAADGSARVYQPSRPAFRQPQNGQPGAPSQRSRPDGRPVYREPQHAPPPQQHSAPPARSAPASRPAPSSSGHGGGGRH